MRIAAAALLCGLAAGCVTHHDLGPTDDAAKAKVAGMRKGWERCVLFSALNEAKASAPADAVAAAMRLCSDEETRFKKALVVAPVGMSAPDAEAFTMQTHEDIEAKTRASLGG